jgi:hypothetical protein
MELATCGAQRHILIDFPQQRVFHNMNLLRATAPHVCAETHISGLAVQRKSPGVGRGGTGFAKYPALHRVMGTLPRGCLSSVWLGPQVLVFL